MNLKSHHGRLNVMRGFRNTLIGLNSPGMVFDYPDREKAHQRIFAAAMGTRAGLDEAKVDEMIWALWECDD